MFGKIIGAITGAEASKSTNKVGGAGGALLGVVSASLLKRLSIPAMLAIGAGGYAYKKYMDKKDAEKAKSAGPEARPSAT